MIALVISTCVRILATLVIVKTLSSLFGVAAFGILTQVMGVSAVFFIFAGGGTANGLIRNVSATQVIETRREWLSAALVICAVSGVLLAAVAIGLFLFAGEAIFKDRRYAPVFLAIGTAQILVGLGNVLSAFINATGKTRVFAAIQIISNVLGAATVVLGSTAFGLQGAAYSLALYPAIAGIAALVVFRSRLRAYAGFAFKSGHVRKLASYSGAMLVAVPPVPLAQIFIRNHLGDHSGWQDVGYWQAAAKISDSYMQILGVLLINYSLPQFSAAHGDPSRTRLVFVRHAAILFAVFFAIVSVLYVFRYQVIHLAYSSLLDPAEAFLPPIFIADFCKLGCLVLLYAQIARGANWLTAVYELYQGVALCVFYLLLYADLGAKAAVYGSVATYGILLVIMLTLFARSSGASGR